MSEIPEPPSAIATAPIRKRRRPALSCEQCRRRKIKCDRNYPCGQCLQSQNASCSYSSDSLGPARHVAIPNRTRSIPSTSRAHTSSVPLSPESTQQSDASHASSWTSPGADVQHDDTSSQKALLDRIQNLERRLASVSSQQKSGNLSSERSTASKELRGTVSKTRFFGSSHWMYSHGSVR
jgi:Fungal Zn(2)-Cys(6) binuclear cluster domain